MNHSKITTSIVGFALAGLTLAGCGSSDLTATGSSASSVNSSSSTSSSTATTVDYTQYADVLSDNKESHADSNDADYDASKATTITLADDDVTISEPGTYILSGTLTDHSVTIDSSADGKVKLVLDNVTMTSSVNSPIIVTAADEVVIILADGSTNTVTDTSAHSAAESDSDAPNAAIFSMDDLTIGGNGALTVTSTASGVDDTITPLRLLVPRAPRSSTRSSSPNTARSCPQRAPQRRMPQRAPTRQILTARETTRSSAARLSSFRPDRYSPARIHGSSMRRPLLFSTRSRP